uniref:Uncharacterized protein n=1 Tax=Candidatus Kentrum sp. SD TaxID=2126332 RepID=A0A450Y7V9_9GAMM|nr:MAG: hypothetical protein BECKSD772F_GA0070984_101715 [Candidatus Kentron sp. SD]VFK41290.1 MAG: hypothetical protein BECKSD772E_GA0070983_101110 [Candidatus Kentron sp. SD]
MESLSICNNDSIHPDVASLDFQKIAWKLSESGEAKMTREECKLAERI